MEDERVQAGAIGDRAKESFLDGCHKYGWIITTGVMIIGFAFSAGGQNAKLEEMRSQMAVMSSQIGKLQDQVYELNHLTRGIREEPK